MKVYEYLCKGDRRTKEYKLLNSKIQEFKEKYGEMVNGKIRLDTGSKNPEVYNFCNIEVSEAICLLNDTMK